MTAASKTVLLVTEKPFAAAAVTQIDDLLKSAGFSLEKLESYTEKSDLLAKIGDVKPFALIVRSDKIDEEVLKIGKANGLLLVVRAGAGFDTIDTKFARSEDIDVMNTPGANANAVAELVFGMIITSARNHYDGTSGFELRGKKLALYGFGAVARNVARIAKGIGMTVVAGDPFLTEEQIKAPVGENPGADEAVFCKVGDTPCDVGPEQLMALFSGSHVVSLHVPATDKTKGSINGDLVKAMGQKACLVNTARKEVVDEDSVAAAMAERTDLTYICDVGLSTGIQDTLGAKRVFTTAKKMGAQTAEANNNAGSMAAAQIAQYKASDAACQRCIVNKA